MRLGGEFMKQLDRNFKLFMRTFNDLCSKFGFQKYDVNFEYKNISKKSKAQISTNEDYNSACVTLNKAHHFLSDAELIRTAKHEFGHLLLGRLNQLAYNRFAESREIDSEVEGLCNLMEIIL